MRFGTVAFILSVLLFGLVMNSHFALGVKYGAICNELNFDDSSGGFCYDFRNASGYIDRNVWNVSNSSGSVKINSTGLYITDKDGDKVFTKSTVLSATTSNLTLMGRSSSGVSGKNDYLLSMGVYGAAGWIGLGYISTSRVDLSVDDDNGGTPDASTGTYTVGVLYNHTINIGIPIAGGNRQVNYTRDGVGISNGVAKTKAALWQQTVGFFNQVDGSDMAIQWVMVFNGTVIPIGSGPPAESFVNSSWNVTSVNIVDASDRSAWINGSVVNITSDLLSFTVNASLPSNMSCVLDQASWNYTYAVSQNVNYLAATINATYHAYTVFDDIGVGDHCLYCFFKVTSSGNSYRSGCLNVSRVAYPAFCNITFPNVNYVNYSFALFNFSFVNATLCSYNTTSNFTVPCSDTYATVDPIFGWNNWSIYGYSEGGICRDNVSFYYNVSGFPTPALSFKTCSSDGWNVLFYFLIALLALSLLYFGIISRDHFISGLLFVFAGVLFIFFAYYIQICVPDLFLVLWIVGILLCFIGIIRAFFRGF